MKRVLLATALLVMAGSALAADNGLYLGASVGEANVQIDENLGFDLDSNDTGYKAIVGFRPLDFLGFEANYVDFGNPQDTVAGVNVETDATGIDAFVVGFLPLPFVDLFAKAGFVSWDSSISANGVKVGDDSGEDLAYGIGVGAHFGSLGVRAEYERFEIENVDDVYMLSLGVTWTFL